MANRTIVEYKIGDLVKWFEPYDDGWMVRDVGQGIVMKINRFSLSLKNVPDPYVTYEVYREKHKDRMVFEPRELEKINA